MKNKCCNFCFILYFKITCYKMARKFRQRQFVATITAKYVSLTRIFVVKQTWKRVGLSAAYRIRSYAPSSRINSPRPWLNLIAFSPARCVRLRGKLRSFCFRATPDTFIMFPRGVCANGQRASRAKI